MSARVRNVSPVLTKVTIRHYIRDIMMNNLCPGKSYSKMYGTEPRYNDLRYNDIPDIPMRI